MRGMATPRAEHGSRTTLESHLGPALAASLQRARRIVAARPLRLVERRDGSLPDAVQDAGAAAAEGRLVLAGGLTANDASTRSVVIAGRRRGVLPVAQHDAPAVALGGLVYVFGGGDGTRQLDHILRVNPVTGIVTEVGRLPAASSDAAAASVGATAYVVGGYTGVRWLNTVVAYRAGHAARIVAHLPMPVRYAAVASVDGLVVIAGGSLPDGTASRAIYRFDPRHATLQRLGSLPRPTTHAAAAALAGRVVVIGGRGAALTARTASIEAIDPRTGQTVPAGHLREAASDLAAVTVGGRIELAGGATAGLRAEQPLEHRRCHRPADVPHRGSRRRRRAAAARHAVLRPAHAVRRQRPRQQPHAARPAHRPAARGAIPVSDPYNLYFTPDGRSAIVVAETHAQLDFNAGGTMLLAGCEFSGELVAVSLKGPRVTRVVRLPGGGMPQDVKPSPDGRTFYVADMGRGGVWLIDARTLRVRGFRATGAGAHGLYVSRDARFLYVTNRVAGTVSVLRFATRRVASTWRIPDGPPDMGGASADGKTLWLSGRYRSEVYAIDTRTGRLKRRIHVGAGPHGLCVWPQPGRYSLGRTGVLR